MSPQSPQHDDVPGVGGQRIGVVAVSSLVVAQLFVKLRGRAQKPCTCGANGAFRQALE
ncbi:MAG: hypothetical protein JRF55_17770 [Deltaproteobacteria bacterium]|nr:hypothetical protein [Deltaproteobacteria bacterium]